MQATTTKYLENSVTPDGRCTQDVKYRIAQAKKHPIVWSVFCRMNLLTNKEEDVIRVVERRIILKNIAELIKDTDGYFFRHSSWLTTMAEKLCRYVELLKDQEESIWTSRK